MLDPVAVERAEKSLDAFISSRAKSRHKANAEEAAYAESIRRHNAHRREQNRAAWRAHHDHMSQLHAALSEAHRAKALYFLVERGEGA